MLKKILHLLLNALVGWLAGLSITLGLAFLWLKIYPLIDRSGQGPGLWLIMLIILGVVSPAAIVGGLVGGKIPREGGWKNQLLLAAVFGILFTLPFACFTLWYTGF